MEFTLEGQVAHLRRFQATHSPLETLALLADHFPGRVSFSTSFGLEDQILTHLIFSHDLPIRVFTLDTGRQFQETYATWNRTLRHYGQPIVVFAPDHAGLEALLTSAGPNSFYEGINARQACCHTRKVEPLRRALANQLVWITGIRAEQSGNRQQLAAAEWDAHHQLVKVHPLLDWTWERAWEYALAHNLPLNPLHQRGFPSIGCAPCTRAVQPGENFRAGRWWWEHSCAKECGLHTTAEPPAAASSPDDSASLSVAIAD